MSSEQYHLIPQEDSYFVSVVLPFAVAQVFTYEVPSELLEEIEFGIRVEVPFGKNKRYAGLVVGLHDERQGDFEIKPIYAVIDQHPIITPIQYQFWQWIADYYSCSIGLVMNAALPGNFKIASETILTLSDLYHPNIQGLNNNEFIICEALNIQNELSIDEVRKILSKSTKQSTYVIIKSLIDKQLILLKEQIKDKYKPKKIACVRFIKKYQENPDLVKDAFELTKRSEKQTTALMAYIQLSRAHKYVRKTELQETAQITSSVTAAMVKKEIFEIYEKQVDRSAIYEEETESKKALSEQQVRALAEINTLFQEKNTVLLHGVTGSGKTRIYVEKIQEVIEQGGQVLYLLPEIALTVQIVSRIQKIFGNDVSIFHSKLNNNERVEIWHQIKGGKPIVLGVRSSLFLPFENLKLIIVDEEHDSSFKQQDPAPRYHARDAAIYLANLHKAKVLLGTATPDLTTYKNAKQGKYGLVEMHERFGGLNMPKIIVVDALAEYKTNRIQSHFTSVLLEHIQTALANKEQVILFQNRRGYAPTIYCRNCDWTQSCKNCDVSLTYHKFKNILKCHYCGFQVNIPKTCPSCGDHELDFRGFGTEKIEDKLAELIPNARIRRMDFDTVKNKHGHAKIIHDFEDKQIDILIGTQMVTKGLDFDNVSIVGILSADHLLRFPDFRASERAFQLMTQVSGRAGRKQKQGKVIIQAFNTSHPVITEVVKNDYAAFYKREIEERQMFNYPPFFRLIQVTIKHKSPQITNDATKHFSHLIKQALGNRVFGPSLPSVSRVKGQYLLVFMIKLERKAAVLKKAKFILNQAANQTKAEKGWSNIRINIDVDPQ